MPGISNDNSCIFTPEFDDDAKRILGRDISIEATLAYILLGKRIGLHPAYTFQDEKTRELILKDPEYFLEGQEVEIILGNSKTAVDYQFERIDKVRQICTSLCCPNIELEQYNRFTSDEIKRDCGLFDDHIVARGSVHPISWSRDAKFRESVRSEIEHVRNVRYGKHLGALIKNAGSHLNASQLQGVLDKLVQLSEDTSYTFSCDSVIAMLIENGFDSMATKIINERLHVLHWKAHEGHDLIVPLAHKLDKDEPHPLDPELFWLTLKIFLGEKIVGAFLEKPWKEQLRIARELRENPIWQRFVAQYISIVEMLAKYTSLKPEKIKSRLKECRPTTSKAAWNELNKWEVVLLTMLLLALGSGITACFIGPGVLQSILAATGVFGGGAGISSIKKLPNIPKSIVQGIRQSAEYDTKELKRILKSKLDMLR